MAGKKLLSALPWSKDAGKDILGGVKQALTVAKGPLSLVPIPALPIAVGAILLIIAACENVSGNKDQLEKLTTHLQSLLTYILNPFVEAQSTSGAIIITDDLRWRVDKLCSQLIDLANETNKLANLSTARRFLRSAELSGTLQNLNTKIDAALNAFRLGGDITKEILLRKVESTLTGMHSHMLDESQRERLDRLPYASARYSNVRTKASECLPNTRVELLQEIYQWVDEEMKKDTPSMFIFWLCGLPGAGKSSIAKTVAKWLDDKDLLGASFFFSRDDDKCNNYQLVIPTIARQLGLFNSAVGLHIIEVLKVQPEVGTDSISYQLENLIIRPLRKAHSNGALPLFAIAMDGLDECADSAQAQNILELLATEFRKLPVPVLIFITSRPESYLESRFYSNKIMPVMSAIRLHDIDQSTVTLDIKRYLEIKLENIASTHIRAPREVAWPLTDDIELLSKQASCLFIYAVTAVTFIGDEDGIPEDRMHILLHRQPVLQEFQDEPYTLIDSLYLRILCDALQGGKRTTPQACDVRDIVGTIITLQYPLTYKALLRFMEIKDSLLHSVLHRLSSVIIYNHSAEVRVRHQSFPDFLARCSHPDFQISRSCHHSRLAKLCLRVLLSNDLRKNMSPNLENSTLNSAIPNAAESLCPELIYACLHFALHLINGGVEDEEIQSQMETFLKTKLLHWFEALSLLGRLDAAITSLSQVNAWYKTSALPDHTTKQLLYDAQRYVQTFFDPICQSAQHVYMSALCFTPHSTLLQTYEHQLETSCMKLLGGRDKQWSECMRVMTGHIGSVNSVAFSTDNTRIVSGSDDGTVHVWDATSGALQATLQGHADLVLSVAVSTDHARIVSGSHDNTVRIWDTTSGALHATLEGHTGSVYSVSFSSDNTRIVSGSSDNTVRIWDATSGSLQATLQGHVGLINSVAFSPDNTRIVSGSDDYTIRVWDAAATTLKATLQGHAGVVHSVSFSSDNTRIVSGSSDTTIRVWDAISGALQAMLEGHLMSVYSVSFSSDNTRIVSGSGDNTVRVWDATSGVLEAMLQGHAQPVFSVVFSSDNTRIVSGSADSTLRMWDAASDVVQATLQGDISVSSIAFSTDNTQIVSGSSDNIIRVWDATSGALQTMLKGHGRGWVMSVAFSSDNSRIASGSFDKTVRVWDATSGSLLATLQGHAGWISSVAFSLDNTRIVSGSYDSTVRVWDANSGFPQTTAQGHTALVNSVAFSNDNTRIVSGSDDHTVRVWDATSGALQATLHGHRSLVKSVSFSTDNTRILSGSDDGTIRVWDIASASQINILHGAQALISASFALDDHGWIRDVSCDYKLVCWVPVSLRRHLKEISRDDAAGRIVFGSAQDSAGLVITPVTFHVYR